MNFGFLYFEYASAIIAVLLFKKYRAYKFYKYFVLYLLSAVIVELLGRYAVKIDKSELFNSYTFFEFNLLVLIYYNLTKEKISKKWILSLTVFFNGFYLFSFVYKEFQKYSVSLLGFVVSIFLILYLRELLNSKTVLKYKSLLPFWVTVGFLIYYLTTIPFFSVHAIGGVTNRDFFSILHCIIIITHSCFIFGLLWSKKTKD